MAVATCLLAAIFATAGLLCLVAAAADIDWFFTSAQSIIGALPRPVARIVSALLGIAILTMAYVIIHDTFPSLF